MTGTYPISLVLTDKPVLVVGGGAVAARKADGLLGCGARVIIVAPEVSAKTRQLIDGDRCVWKTREYQASDLEGMTLVFACTNDEVVNVDVYRDARSRGLLVNVADCPEFCDFYLPSVLRRDNLSIAVSTNGSSPLTARIIREKLENQFGEEMGAYLRLLQSWRPQTIAVLSAGKRQLFWQRVNDSQVYELVSCGETRQAEALLERLLEESKAC
ncbi:MAG: bifunctional precorrin-2 dehydrogenase/sirohydrochlorin ferrochelatase [Coriobacteriales bacterium]|jgi:precorrin-2 dehydrogenase/sirohydrochlorin ferrochelatase|nr:bifunctional precorrin-2 dehydrogenase/sirohydrochlorin ferrochelatase [Coriobacteriales bacterium]